MAQICLFLFTCLQVNQVRAQSLEIESPPSLISSAEQLLIEQVEQLVLSGETTEAITILEELLTSADGRVVSSGDSQLAGTLEVHRYLPMSRWAAERTARILSEDPKLREEHSRARRIQSQEALNAVGRTKDIEDARRNADLFYGCSDAVDHCMLLADICMEHGWSLEALDAIERASPSLRFDFSKIVTTNEQLQPRGTSPWYIVWGQCCSMGSEISPAAASLLREWIENHRLENQDSGKIKDSLLRLAHAAAIDREVVGENDVREWIERLIAEDFYASELQAVVDDIDNWQVDDFKGKFETFAGAENRTPRVAGTVDVDTDFPQWSRRLQAVSTGLDRNPASGPRVGENGNQALTYHPVVSDGKLFVAGLEKIFAFDLSNGSPWPSATAPLFASRAAKEDQVPIKFPHIGVPRRTCTIVGGHLYARMGNPVTGWATRKESIDGGSLSYLVGLDLGRQGSLLPGFPLRLKTSEFQNAEFEGSPLVWGDDLVVMIAERDNVGIRRRVAAFDRISGELKWRSQVLATGTIGDEHTNSITHQLLTLAGGRIYCSTDLGAVCCLDPSSGRILWVTQYAAHNSRADEYPRPNRFLYRDLTPPVVAGGLVYCAPRDRPEVFALDAITGDLIWSTDRSQSADLIHMLGVSENNLVVSGDRVVWLCRRTGSVQASFPASTTPGRLNALPAPRGLGRGAIVGGSVLHPVAGQVLVFPSSLPHERGRALLGRTPKPTHRLTTGVRGGGGGNIFSLGEQLFIASPSRVMAFD